MSFFKLSPTICVVLVSSGLAHGYDLNDKLSIGGVMAGAGQCQEVSHAMADDRCMAGLSVQPELDFHPTKADQLFFKLGFGAGNGLNDDSPFLIPAWNVDLADDVKNINGRGRDYLLTAWYKHTFTLSSGNAIGVTAGLIDSTDYLDDNAYANDGYAQFMNGALGNGPYGILPSYDAGGVVQWDIGPWSLRGVYMNVGENDDGNSFDFQAAQLGYTLETSLGEGHYRFLVVGASADFLNPEGTKKENRAAVSISLDQQLGKVLGVFARFGWQDDQAAVDYEAIYSGGVDIKGGAWGREADNIGLGFAYLNGGNLDVNHSLVAESYYRLALNDEFALTADIQYMKDDVRTGDSPEGWIFGLRAVVGF